MKADCRASAFQGAIILKRIYPEKTPVAQLAPFGPWSPVKETVTELSLDYAGLVGDLRRPLAAVEVGQVLLDAAGDRYQRVCACCSLVQFVQSGAAYLFDMASAVDAEQEDRTVAAWAVTPAAVSRRDVSYQRGFPLAAAPGCPPADRGHLIPHLSGRARRRRAHRRLNPGISSIVATLAWPARAGEPEPNSPDGA